MRLVEVVFRLDVSVARYWRRRDGGGSFNEYERANIMGTNPTLGLPKLTATTSVSTTPVQPSSTPVTKPTNLVTTSVPEVKPEAITKDKSESVKTVSEGIKSTVSTETASTENKTVKPSAEKTVKATKSGPDEPTKMAVATEIYKQMMKTKGMTRKEVLEQFVLKAKLTKAGSSTYFQLIKAAQK